MHTVQRTSLVTVVNCSSMGFRKSGRFKTSFCSTDRRTVFCSRTEMFQDLGKASQKRFWSDASEAVHMNIRVLSPRGDTGKAFLLMWLKFCLAVLVFYLFVLCACIFGSVSPQLKQTSRNSSASTV